MEPRPLKMATLNHARSFQGCPEEEGIHILVLDTNSQHPHKGTHTFTMSLRRMTIVLTLTPVQLPEHTRNAQRETAWGCSL